MPTIYESGGFKIFMYFEDHNPPHFHIVTKNEEAMVSIATLEIIEGSVSRKTAKAALKWTTKNQEPKNGTSTTERNDGYRCYQRRG